MVPPSFTLRLPVSKNLIKKLPLRVPRLAFKMSLDPVKLKTKVKHQKNQGFVVIPFENGESEITIPDVWRCHQLLQFI